MYGIMKANAQTLFALLPKQSNYPHIPGRSVSGGAAVTHHKPLPKAAYNHKIGAPRRLGRYGGGGGRPDAYVQYPPRNIDHDVQRGHWLGEGQAEILGDGGCNCPADVMYVAFYPVGILHIVVIRGLPQNGRGAGQAKLADAGGRHGAHKAWEGIDFFRVSHGDICGPAPILA